LFVLLGAGQLYISAVLIKISSGSQGLSVAEGVRRQAAEGLKGLYELPKTGDFGPGIFAEVLPPEHRGLRVGSKLQYSYLAGRGLEMFG
jgi:hypothetical protein